VEAELVGTYYELLAKQIRDEYPNTPAYQKLLDPWARKVAGLSILDVEVLIALIFNIADIPAAIGYKAETVELVLNDLVARGAVELKDGAYVPTAGLGFELSFNEGGGEYAYQLTNSPLKTVLLRWKDLGKVYTFLYGRKPNWALLKKIEKIIGHNQTVLLMLEHCTKEFEGEPLQTLIQYAYNQRRRY
jgi:hypothetical protein